MIEPPLMYMRANSPLSNTEDMANTKQNSRAYRKPNMTMLFDCAAPCRKPMTSMLGMGKRAKSASRAAAINPNDAAGMNISPRKLPH